jgi:response regulator RpfG family c-di-GMP phosphodiesterase
MPAQIGLAARFHDIGKIGIPDDVLLAPRRHTDEERAIMREHPVRGEHIFLATGRSDAAPVARLIRAHHEAFDGSGYPDGLRGESSAGRTHRHHCRCLRCDDQRAPVSRRDGA